MPYFVCAPPPGNVGTMAAGLLGTVRLWLDSSCISENCSQPAGISLEFSPIHYGSENVFG